MTTKSPRSVSCPQCGEPVLWTEASSFRPFCSARCKGIDLGAWASGDYAIAAVSLEDKIEDADNGNERPN